MEPEIARRCKSCGAAIRSRSAFCPQCGVSLAEDGASSAQAGAPVAAALETTQLGTLDQRPSAETITPAAKTEAAVKAEAPAEMQAPAPEGVRGQDAASSGPPVSPPPASVVAPGVAPVADAAPGKRQRVAAIARDVVDESVRPRAEKLRRASNVVLDEAAADPSLRFVLVAAALIIISLLLLLLARVI